MIIPALAILSGFAAVFAWCAFAVARSADDDAVALQQLAARQHAQEKAEQPVPEFRGVVGAFHGGSNK